MSPPYQSARSDQAASRAAAVALAPPWLDVPVLLTAGVDARPIERADSEFLQALDASTRADEIAQAGWLPVGQDLFLAQQFELQHRCYLAHYADADFLLLRQGDAEPPSPDPFPLMRERTAKPP